MMPVLSSSKSDDPHAHHHPPSQLCANFGPPRSEEQNTRTMDSIILILFSWFFVAILCYFFILAYNRRRRNSLRGTASFGTSIWGAAESGQQDQKFLHDLATWLLWGLDENAQNEQRMAPAFGRFAVKCLNEAAWRLHKENQPEVRFESVQLADKSTISALSNFRIHPNRTPGNHLSITGHFANTPTNRNGPIWVQCSLLDPSLEEETTTQEQQHLPHADGGQRRQMPVLVRGPAAARERTLLVHEIVGEVEVRLASIAGELFVIGCFKERPAVRLEVVESVGPQERAFLEDFVRRCLLGAVLNFSIGELLYPDAETSARASRARLSAEYRNLSFLQEVYPPNGVGAAAHLEGAGRSRMSPKFPLDGEEEEGGRPVDLHTANCLRLQLVEATDLEGLHPESGERPFVCIELDEPSGERFLSARAHLDHQQQNGGGGDGQRGGGRRRVFWHDDEANFELLVNSASGELLFEVFTEEAEENSYSTVRERRFLGMAILNMAELRQIVSRQTGGAGLVRLQLQGRPEFHHQQGGGRGRAGDHVRGVLVLKCSFHHRPAISDRPSAPFPVDGVQNGGAEYAQIRRRGRSPAVDEQAPAKKLSTSSSTMGSASKRLTRQKQHHYIYQVTEDRLPHENNNYESEGEKRSPSKISFDTSPSRPPPEYAADEDPAYSTIGGGDRLLGVVNPVRKTISDRTNAALFQFNGGEREERKRSAPETPASARRGGGEQNGTMPKSSMRLIQERVGEGAEPEEVHIHRPNEPYEHLFDGRRGQEGHPAMEIFKMPEGLKQGDGGEGEIGRRARERDRSARGRKQRRNFFEQIRARLSGPVRFLPGMHGKRAKSLDDYEHPNLEEVASMPQSRDQSQHRYGGDRRKGSDVAEGTIDGQHQQQLFIKSAGPSSASSMQFLPSPQQSSSQRTTTTFSSSYNPNQMLLLELVGPDEEGTRYYSIPMEISTEPAVIKLMQSGKKLHVHNAHLLVASKSRGRVVCSICGKRIGGNFSNRQAYQCRDCRIVCHKNCHRQIDWACENSALHNLHVEQVDWEEFLRHHQLREFISIGNL